MIHPRSCRRGIFMRLSDYSVATPSRPNARWALMLAGLTLTATLAVVYVDTHTELKYQWQKRNTVLELRELPLGQVKVRGVLTCVDNANKRLWLQDETGAIAVNQDPKLTDTHLSDLVQVEMRKTHAYDPT